MKKIIALGSVFLACLVPIGSQATDISELTKPCEACHGNQGRAGPDGYYPRLAGKSAGYLYNQMENFAHGRRRYAMMQRMMAPLSPQYRQEMASYFSNLKVPYEAPPSKNPALSASQLARGKQLALLGDAKLDIPACNTCHGDQLMGNQSHVPGLLGLPSAYLGAQLSAWTLGERSTVSPDCMGDIAKRLSAEDAAAVTGWLATQDASNHVVKSKPQLTNKVAHCASAPELHGVTK